MSAHTMTQATASWTGLVLPATGQPRMRRFYSLDDLNHAVNGWIEFLFLPEFPNLERRGIHLALIINEEGKIQGLIHNPRATRLAFWFNEGFRLMSDYVSGSAVLVAHDRATGELVDLPLPAAHRIGSLLGIELGMVKTATGGWRADTQAVI